MWAFLSARMKYSFINEIVWKVESIDPYHKSLDKYPTIHLFVTEMCTRAHFCYKMVHCGIWDWCIVGFVQQVCTYPCLGQFHTSHTTECLRWECPSASQSDPWGCSHGNSATQPNRGKLNQNGDVMKYSHSPLKKIFQDNFHTVLICVMDE